MSSKCAMFFSHVTGNHTQIQTTDYTWSFCTFRMLLRMWTLWRHKAAYLGHRIGRSNSSRADYIMRTFPLLPEKASMLLAQQGCWGTAASQTINSLQETTQTWTKKEKQLMFMLSFFVSCAALWFLYSVYCLLDVMMSKLPPVSVEFG